MSLSDSPTNEFKPMKLEFLETFDDEQYNRGKDTEPDLDRFKVLYEPKKLTEDEPDIFEFLYDYRKEALTEKNDFIATFTSLNTPSKDMDGKKKKIDPGELEETAAPEDKEASGPEEPEAEKPDPGFEEGYKRGFEQGRAKGYATGFEEGKTQGLVKGEDQGREKGEKSGFDLGFSKGEKEATQAVHENAKELLDMLSASLEKSDQVYEKLIDTYEEKILSLVNAIAEKIIFQKIRTDDEVVKYAIIDALKHLAEPEEVVLSVSVEDYEYIEMVKESFFEEISSLKNISVISDDSIHRGGCRIKTSTGTISADPKAKFDAIIDSLARAKNR